MGAINLAEIRRLPIYLMDIESLLKSVGQFSHFSVGIYKLTVIVILKLNPWLPLLLPLVTILGDENFLAFWSRMEKFQTGFFVVILCVIVRQT